MGSNSFTGSKRLTDLGQQLRLYKPLPPSLEKNSNKDSGNQYSWDKVVAQELDLNAESETNPVANKPKRFRPKRAAVLICLFEGEEDEEEEADLRVILTKRSSTLSTHSGKSYFYCNKNDKFGVQIVY